MLNIAIQIKLREADGLKFGELGKFHLDWTDLGGMRIRFDNLFNGDKSLEDSAHAIINESWQSIFEVLREPLNGTLKAVIKDILGKILTHVPASYLMNVL